MAESYFTIPVGDHPALARIQSEVCARLPSMQPEPAERFHITLCYITDDHGAEARRVTARGVPAFTAQARALHSFPAGEDGYPVILRVERTPFLVALQRMIYEQMARQGCEFSPFSDPAHYQPHVTLGYADRGVVRVTLRAPIAIACDRFVLSEGDYEVAKSFLLGRGV